MKMNRTASGRYNCLKEAFRRCAGVTLLLTCFGVIGLVAGCQSNPPVFSGQNSLDKTDSLGSNASSGSALLHEGDVLQITFEGTTNLNSTVKIQLDGNINLQLIGSVKAADKSLQELRLELMERYKGQLNVPELSVSLVSNAAVVYVSGAVLRPGRIAMERPLTALDAIMEAGGFDNIRAKSSAVTVLRTENGRQEHFTLDLGKALNGEDPTPFWLRPFDIVHVPAKTFRF